MFRDSSCFRDFRPKSRCSSRAASHVSAANFEWIVDVMKKCADDANSRESSLVEEARQREREIRADMKQLAASEARVAALEQQLHDQTQLKDPRGDILFRRERPCFSDIPARSQVSPYCPSSVMSDHYVTSVPVVVPRYD